jgi:predicted metal-dependent hydrolase|tara:strand:+ start:669 stop:1346 length:678 start_codon:yes stop_codon:yes gene_type:complete
VFEVPKLIIGDKEIDYTIRKGSSSRYTYLRFRKDLSLLITLPKRSSVDSQTIIKDKRKWIEAKYQKLSKRMPIIDGDQILFSGEYHRLEVKYSDKAVVKISRKKIILFITSDIDSKTLLRDWMTEETWKIVGKIIPLFAHKLGVKVSNIRVKGTSRWGYCKRKGELTFNWQLAGLPRDLSQYIILHEIVHLSEFNHSKHFKKKLESVCPDFRNREIRLNNYNSIP